MSKPTPAKAFKRATAGYELFRKKLLPFSSLRQGVAATMGMRFGLVDREDIFSITVEDVKGRKSQELQFYNQLFSDVVKVMWLCNVPDSRALRAERRIDEAKIEAFKWADEKGIALTSEPYYAAAAVFFQIMQDVAVSTGEPILPDNGSAGDEESGED